MAGEIYTNFEDAFTKMKPNRFQLNLVIVTRGHRDDMRVLAWAVNTEARYIGMIGSKRKVLSVLSGARDARAPRRSFRPRACARGPRYRRAHAGRDRHQHHRGIDCRAPQRHFRLPQIRPTLPLGVRLIQSPFLPDAFVRTPHFFSKPNAKQRWDALFVHSPPISCDSFPLPPRHLTNALYLYDRRHHSRRR